MRATGHWGEPPGVVSAAPTCVLEGGSARDRPRGRAPGRGFRGASEVPRAVPQTRILVGFSTKRDDACNIVPLKRRDRAPERPQWAHLACIAPKRATWCPRWGRDGPGWRLIAPRRGNIAPTRSCRSVRGGCSECLCSHKTPNTSVFSVAPHPLPAGYRPAGGRHALK